MTVKPSGDTSIAYNHSTVISGATHFAQYPTNYATSGGSANAQTLTFATPFTSLIQGQEFTFIAGFTNTAATTLQIDSTTARAIVNTQGQALDGGEIKAGSAYKVIYDLANTQFLLIGPAFGLRDWTPTLGANGSMTFTSTTTHFARYAQFGHMVFIEIYATGTVGGTVDDSLTFTLPATPQDINTVFAAMAIRSSTEGVGGRARVSSTSGNGTVTVNQYDNSNWTAGIVRGFSVSGFYRAT